MRILISKPFDVLRYGRRQSHVLRERQQKEAAKLAEVTDANSNKNAEVLQPSSSRCSTRSNATNTTDNDPVYSKINDDITKPLTPTGNNKPLILNLIVPFGFN